MFPYLIAGAIGYAIAKIFEEETPKYADGGSVLLAPNGKPSNLTPEQYKLVRTPEFKAWFGDWENDPENSSKVVDVNGEPLVVYHGTNKDFYEFDLTYFGKTDDGFYGKGFYFTPNLETAEVYASISEWDKMNNTFKKNGKTLPLFLNFRNPILIDLKKFKIKNEDGTNDSKIIIPNSIFSANTEYLAFEPNQIKLADGKNTTFDGNNPDIRYDGGGDVSYQNKSIKHVLELEGFTILKNGLMKYGDIDVTLWMQHKYQVNRGEHYLWDVEYNPNDTQTKIAVIDKIVNNSNRNKGLASVVLDKIVRASDLTNTTLQLFSEQQDKKGLTTEQLIEWYKKRGFKFDEDKMIMERKPANIYSDGGSLLLAPNGKPSNLTPEQYKLVRTPAFKKWFGDWQNDPANASKVVDSNGEPLVVYHGSNKKIDSFRVDENQYIYFTNDINLADKYAIHRSKKLNGEKYIYNIYLKIINPLIIDANFESWDYISTKSIENSDIAVKDLLKRGIERITTNFAPKIAIKNGFDGVIISNIYDGVGYGKDAELSNVYIALYPNQIKLADGTNTTFDVNNPDVRYAGGGNTQPKDLTKINNFENIYKGAEYYSYSDNLEKQEKADRWYELFTKNQKEKIITPDEYKEFIYLSNELAWEDLD